MGQEGARNPGGIGMWHASPLHDLNRFIEHLPSVSKENKIHVRLVIKRIMANENDLENIPRQIVARSICATYAALVEAQTTALRLRPGSARYEKLWADVMRLQSHVTKLFLALGIRKDDGKGKGNRGRAVGCSPPRPRRPSEVEAESLPGGPADNDTPEGESLDTLAEDGE